VGGASCSPPWPCRARGCLFLRPARGTVRMSHVARRMSCEPPPVRAARSLLCASVVILSLMN